MANTKSAQKAARKIERRTAVNKYRRSQMRTYVRKVEEALAAKDAAGAAEALQRRRAAGRPRRAEGHRPQERRRAEDFAPDQARQGARGLNAFPTGRRGRRPAERSDAMTDQPPDRLCVDPDEPLLRRGGADARRRHPLQGPGAGRRRGILRQRELDSRAGRQDARPQGQSADDQADRRGRGLFSHAREHAPSE